MATLDITLFLITQFYVYKMDADLRKRRRNISQREQRWSMNSQRLEEIVAELMKPISDVRRSFDTDLSALLEKYLTEAGLHALAAAERSQSSQAAPATPSPTPNFAELALLLQQSASIYGRKVDCLYAHVLCVSDALHDNTQESSGAPDETLTPSAGRRKRKASVSGEFAAITLENCAGARREPLAPRPPPTLPRMYVELEPRVVAPGDVPLTDYTGEPIGLLGDFLVSRRLEGGLLVDELACGGEAPTCRLRAAPLLELQAAIVAASSPAPPSLPSHSPPPHSPPPHSPPPPSPPASPALVLETPPATPTSLSLLSPPPSTCLSVPSSERKERKRRSAVDSEDAVDGRVKLIISKKLRGKLRRVEEFSLPPRWVTRVVSSRAAALRATRRQCPDHDQAESDFRGFDISDSIDVGGFMGWSGSEAAAAVSLSASLRVAGGEGTSAGGEGCRADDSDDDGFFEQSSLGDSDTSRADDTNATALSSLPGGGCEWWGWRETVMSRSAAAAARGADVSAGARALLSAAAALPPPASCDALLAATAEHEHDVSKLFLSALFLANAGNIEIVQGPPLSVNSFSVRVLSTDERLYRSVADDLPGVHTYQ